MLYACPCCGYKTFSEKPNGNFDICPVCFWEDDPWTQDDPDYEGGANHGVSLRKAQKNFIEFGVCEKEMIKNVRPPRLPQEARDADWKFLEQL